MSAPALRPFRMTTEVRFPEVDSYQVVWHGHYVLYMEIVRDALCRAGGLTPGEALAAGYKSPITKVSLKLRRPALLDDILELSVLLRPTEIARIEMDYEIRRLASRELLATAFTQQVLLSKTGELLLTLPKGLRTLVGRILAYQRGELELPGEKIPIG